MYLKNVNLFFCLFFFFAQISHANTLIIEPDMGRVPLINTIEKAKSIDIVMYGLTDGRLLNALIQAKKTGKSVRILLEPRPYKNENENTWAIRRLTESNIKPQFHNHIFKLTHQKTLLLDQHQAIIMTFNFTPSTFKKERNFALILTDPQEVKEIQTVFNADWQHKNTIINNSNLIWSPNNSREKITALIQSARKEIKIYTQEITDYKITGLLANAARQGINIKILTSSYDNKPLNKKMQYLIRSGVQIRFSKNKIIHAKVIIIDHNQAALGSINFTTQSIENNRELSILIHEKKIIHQLEETFEQDWQN